jgi:hypothetical protein
VRRETLMIHPADATTPITLRDVVNQSQYLLSLGVPPETPLSIWANPGLLRDELVFEVKTPIETADHAVLLDSVAHKLGAEYKQDEARAELERRLNAAQES